MDLFEDPAAKQPFVKQDGIIRKYFHQIIKDYVTILTTIYS